MTIHLPLRLKRLRRTPAIRDMLRETRLCPAQLIAPIFISAQNKEPRAIPSMPGQYQWTIESLDQEINALCALGIPAVLLFGIPPHKDPHGQVSCLEEGIIQRAIRRIRQLAPHLTIIADVCLCEYTSHGHCGILAGESIDNDATLAALGQQAVSYAQAGADWVAPSSMTDGMVRAIRQDLDRCGYTDVAILSYAVKYSSCFYGPFREAAQGAPQFGDRKSYQMDPANANEAVREALLDVDEGADLIMVKPATHYLDIIHRIKQACPNVPLCAYQVSGEYSMIKLAASHGLFDETQAMEESVLAIKRAGADLIITYFAKDLAQLLLRG